MNNANPYGNPVSDSELDVIKAAAAKTPPNSAERDAVEVAVAARRYAIDAARLARREAAAKARINAGCYDIA
jgi:hypothetical protein